MDGYRWTTRVGLGGLGSLALLAAVVAVTRIFDLVVAGVQPEARALTAMIPPHSRWARLSLLTLVTALMETWLRRHRSVGRNLNPLRRYPRPSQRSKPMQTTGLMVVLAITVMLMVGIACNGPRLATPPEIAIATAVPEPSPTGPSIDGATWILESIDGQPPIRGTYATLTVNGLESGGFDGCNSFGGRHEPRSLVIKQNGEISLPPFGGTDRLCVSPPGIMEQADRYLDAMQQPAKGRVVDDRLHIVDGSGEVRLVFVRQSPLAGRPMDLVGTSWRLVDDDLTYGEGATTLLFLDSRAATGTTACRDYTVGYTAFNGGIRMPDQGMSGSTEPCSRDAVEREHLFVEDFGWANEYSVHQMEGSERLVVRTSKGKTLTFQPLPEPTGAIFDTRWRLTRFLEKHSYGSGLTRPKNTDLVPGADITAAFAEGSIEGSLGCHSYAYRVVGEDGATLIDADGTISIDDAALSTENSCDDQVSLLPQQRQYLDFLAAADRYHVFGDRLVILTRTGDALVFQRESTSTEAGQPGPDWTRVEAPGWSDQPGFSLLLPPGWALNELQGIDSYVGEVTGDGVRLMFDYGSYSWGLNPEDEPEHEYVVSYEDIGGLRAKLLLPVKSPSGATADHPPAIGVYFHDLGGASFNLIGRGLTPDQQRVAVGIFRSVRVLE